MNCVSLYCMIRSEITKFTAALQLKPDPPSRSRSVRNTKWCLITTFACMDDLNIFFLSWLNRLYDWQILRFMWVVMPSRRSVSWSTSSRFSIFPGISSSSEDLISDQISIRDLHRSWVFYHGGKGEPESLKIAEVFSKAALTACIHFLEIEPSVITVTVSADLADHSGVSLCEAAVR